MRRLGPLVVAVLLLSAPSSRAPGATTQPVYEGFGATTVGGLHGAVVRVTNLGDAGPGSLRDALSAGDRTVVFDVAGEIVLAGPVYVNGANVTIDGFTAPAPGVTLKNFGLVIWGSRGAHDVIVRGLRIRNAAGDGITIKFGASNIVIDHVSIHGSTDGNVDITRDTRDVTLSWSIFAEPALDQKNMLIKYHAARITLHHNLFVRALQRNPQVRIDDVGTPATETTLDMRNNLIWNWGAGSGTRVWYGPHANLVDNFYGSPGSAPEQQQQALVVCNGDCGGGDPASAAWAFVSGNVSADDLPFDLNTEGTATLPFDAPAVATTDACSAAHAVLASSGLRPLDATDAAVLAGISLPPCLADLGVSSLSAPAAAMPGSTISIAVATRNYGAAPAAAGTTSLHLSRDGALDTADIVLGSVPTPALGPGETHAGAVGATIPAGTSTGAYYLIAKADAGAVAEEANELNNTASRTFTVGIPDLAVSSLSMPSTLKAGAAVLATDSTRNRGSAPASASITAFYLSPNKTWDAADIPLANRPVPALGPGATSTATTAITIPAGTAAGAYYIIVRADAVGAVAEGSETNNHRVKSVTISP